LCPGSRTTSGAPVAVLADGAEGEDVRAPAGETGAERVEGAVGIDEDAAAVVATAGMVVRAGLVAVLRTPAEEVHPAVSRTSAVITNRRTGPPSHRTGPAPGCRLR
jgi:hypothetical protein